MCRQTAEWAVGLRNDRKISRLMYEDQQFVNDFETADWRRIIGINEKNLRDIILEFSH